MSNAGSIFIALVAVMVVAAASVFVARTSFTVRLSTVPY
jgi:hypothetical protein